MTFLSLAQGSRRLGILVRGLCQERGHPHLLEHALAAVGAAAVGPQGDGDPASEHLAKRRDAVTEEGVRDREHIEDATGVEAEEALGDRFDIRGFHEVVLGNGMVPLPVLATAVAEWIERS